VESAEGPQPFRFVTHLTLTELTGRRAHDLLELVQHLKIVPLTVVYYHTHHFLERNHHLTSSPPNDFAFWVSHSLKEPVLGEHLAAIDTIQFTSLSALRDVLVAALEAYLRKASTLPVAPEGSEFVFMSSRSILLPTPYEARTLEEFAEALPKISLHSLYHHVFEARLRMDKGNDFAEWIKDLGEQDLAWQITLLDPYTQSLSSLRRQILKLVQKRLAEKTHVAA
jgi:hypothetical protein